MVGHNAQNVLPPRGDAEKRSDTDRPTSTAPVVAATAGGGGSISAPVVNGGDRPTGNWRQAPPKKGS